MSLTLKAIGITSTRGPPVDVVLDGLKMLRMTAIAPNAQLLAAASAADFAAVRRALQEGADPNCCDQAGSTPLHFAVRRRRRDIASVLILAGASPHVPDAFGDTAWSLAPARSECWP